MSKPVIQIACPRVSRKGVNLELAEDSLLSELTVPPVADGLAVTLFVITNSQCKIPFSTI
jgi:hypothetical protein